MALVSSMGFDYLFALYSFCNERMIQMDDRDQEYESFLDFWGITEEEEKLFWKFYRREVRYRWAIVILVVTVIVLSVALWLR